MRLLSAGALLLASLVQPPARAADPPSGWIVTRTGPGAAVFSAWLNAEAGGSGATVVAYALKGRGAAREHDRAFTTTRIDWGFDGWVDVYGHPASTPPCVAAACDDPLRTPARIMVHTNGHRIGSTVLVAAWDATTTLEVTSPGWRARPWRPAMRAVRAADGGGRGVRVTHTTYGTFKAAEAPGGRHGSSGFAALPCGDSGGGHGELTGGRQRFTLDCERGRRRRTTAPRGTRWRLAGEVDGRGPIVNVLVVVDHPR